MTTITGISPLTQRRAAMAAGLAYLLSFATVVFTMFVVQGSVSVPGDVVASMRKIGEHPGIHRLSAVLDLCYGVGVIVQVAALYVLLAPVSRLAALTAALWRGAYVAIWTVTVLGMLTAARLSGAPDFQPLALSVPTRDLYELVNRMGWDGYYVGLVFTSLANALFGWLFFRSRYVPRWLAGATVAASVWCVITTCAYLIDPGFRNSMNWWLFDTPMAVSDIVLSLWLVFRGVETRDAS